MSDEIVMHDRGGWISGPSAPFLALRVNGIPAPQGSKRHVGKGRMVEMSRAVGPWREAVRAETQRATGYRPGRFAAGVPVAVGLTFYLRRPLSTPKRVKYPAKRPDLDKLTRAVLDGLVSGGAIADDSQVITLTVSKFFATDDAPGGCLITIEGMT